MSTRSLPDAAVSVRALLSPLIRLGAARNVWLAAVLMLAASALFALQAALVKVGLEQLAPLELVFFRGLVCAALILAFAKLRGLSLASARPAGQLALGLVGFVSLALYFASIGMLPLATATALNYTAPLFLALLIALRHARTASTAALLPVAGGFLGVWALLEPSFAGGSSTGVWLGLISGLTGAFAYLLLGRLGRAGEPQRVTAFYFSVFVCVFAGIPTLTGGLSIVGWEQLALVLAIGLLATFAQLAMTQAYAISTPLVPATLSYSAVIFSSMIGAWWWGDQLGLWDALGIGLIVAGGILVSAGQACAAASPAVAPDRDAAEKQRRREDRRNNLRSIFAAFMLGRRPDQVKYVFMMGDSQDNIAEGARTRAEISDPFTSPALESLWQSRFCPLRYNVDDLLQLPAHTLGGAYARHMKSRGFRPDFYEEVAPRHRMHFLRLRVRQTHDIWHVLSGFDTDEFGEVGLQGFYFAQFTNGQSALIAASAILKSVLRGRFGDLELHIDAFCEGYRNGKNAESLLAVEWEHMWGDDLQEVRRRYRIDPPRCRAGALALSTSA